MLWRPFSWMEMNRIRIVRVEDGQIVRQQGVGRKGKKLFHGRFAINPARNSNWENIQDTVTLRYVENMSVMIQLPEKGRSNMRIGTMRWRHWWRFLAC